MKTTGVLQLTQFLLKEFVDMRSVLAVFPDWLKLFGSFFFFVFSKDLTASSYSQEQEKSININVVLNDVSKS